MTRRSLLLLLVLVVACIGLAALEAWAAESFCPGQPGHRSDIKKCIDFESAANCSTGQENACWQGNGFGSAVGTGPYAPMIRHTGGAAVGEGYVSTKGRKGSVIGGFYQWSDLINSNAFSMRWYVRYTGGWLGWAGHGIQMDFGLTGGPNGAIKVQVDNWSMEVHQAGALFGPGRLANVAVHNVKNDKWHQVEMYGKAETSCPGGVSNPTGCNGVLKLWVDDVLVMHHTNMNYRFLENPGSRFGVWSFFPQQYLHNTVASWEPTIQYDQWVVSDCSGGVCDGAGPPIGPASGENAPGTGAAASPYRQLSAGQEAFTGHNVRGDCSVNNTWNNTSQVFGTASLVTFQGSIVHNGFNDDDSNQCDLTVSQLPGLSASTFSVHYDVSNLLNPVVGNVCTGGGSTRGRCAWNGTQWIVTNAVDHAGRVQITSGSGNGGWFSVPNNPAHGNNSVIPLTTVPNYFINGWIYLPSSNNYTFTGSERLALSGFTRTDNAASPGYVALSIMGTDAAPTWAIREQDNLGNATMTNTNVAVPLDQWVQYEIGLHQTPPNGAITLRINGVKLINAMQLDSARAIHPGTWFWSAAENPATVVGVVQLTGTAPFTAYFDDHLIASVSAQSCDGWGTDCPFSGLTGSTSYDIVGNDWRINGAVTHLGAPAEGLLMNARMVNSVLDDATNVLGGGYSETANTTEFINQMQSYIDHGVRAFTVGLQGGNPNPVGSNTYDPGQPNFLNNTAYNSDGSLKTAYMDRVLSVIQAADQRGALIILSLFYQRQDQLLANQTAVRAAVDNVCAWLVAEGVTNVLVEITNEYGHSGFTHTDLLVTGDANSGQIHLLNRMRTCLTNAGRSDIKLSTSSTLSNLVYGLNISSGVESSLVAASDYLILHANTACGGSFPSAGNSFTSCYASQIAAVVAGADGKPILINEDPRGGETGDPQSNGVAACQASVAAGSGWGFFKRSNQAVNDLTDFMIFLGASEAQAVYDCIDSLTTTSVGPGWPETLTIRKQ